MFKGYPFSDTSVRSFWSFLPPRFFCLSILFAHHVIVFSLGFRGYFVVSFGFFLYRVSYMYSWSYLKQNTGC